MSLERVWEWGDWRELLHPLNTYSPFDLPDVSFHPDELRIPEGRICQHRFNYPLGSTTLSDYGISFSFILTWNGANVDVGACTASSAIIEGAAGWKEKKLKKTVRWVIVFYPIRKTVAHLLSPDILLLISLVHVTLGSIELQIDITLDDAHCVL